MLITGGMGSGLAQRLKKKGVQALLTDASDPVDAVMDRLKAVDFPQHLQDCGALLCSFRIMGW